MSAGDFRIYPLKTLKHPKIAGLLVRLVRRKTSAGYVGQLLAAFRDEERAMTQDGLGRKTPPPCPSGIESLVEPLTSREAEVLALLARRLSNKEIAQKLFLSPTTVKRYTIHIYQKLGVNSRRDAVDKAHALGLLTRT